MNSVTFVLSMVFAVICSGCKGDRDSEMKEDYFREWASYKANPKDFFALLSQSRPMPAETDTAEEFNENTLQSLNTLDFSPLIAGRKDSITHEEAKKLLKIVANHPVGGLYGYQKNYDPNNQGIGFCFGRAMIVHLEGLWNESFKLQNDRIRKLFAVGTLQSPKGNWRYHVTAVVKASEGGWWAIDPMVLTPMKAEEWVKTIQMFNPAKDMLVFHDKAMTFGGSGVPYRLPDLNDATYNDYFKDLLNHYRKSFRDRKGNG